MLMQNFGVTDKEHHGMLWYFLEWSIGEWMVNATGVTAAMFVDKNKRVSLRWEINTYLPKFDKRGALFCQLTWLPCHDKIKKGPLAKNQSVSANWEGDISTSML